MISNIIGIFIVDYFGNRTILLASFNVCGLVFIAAGLLPLGKASDRQVPWLCIGCNLNDFYWLIAQNISGRLSS